MVFQIPWSSGWSAQVNGEDVPLLQADECYMGLPLSAGMSTVRLTYHTPWGRVGLALSFAGWVLLVAGAVMFHRLRKRAVPVA